MSYATCLGLFHGADTTTDTTSTIEMTTSAADPPPAPAIAASFAGDDGLAHIAPPLRIDLVYQDEAIIVVHKPCNLRSVPGNAEPPPSSTTGKRKERDGYDDSCDTTNNNKPLSAQEAWVAAIQRLAEQAKNKPTATTQKENDEDDDNDQQMLQPSWFCGLGGQKSQRTSIPRKYAPFSRYVQRSRRRIFGLDEQQSIENNLARITKQIFQRIEHVQREILSHHRPASTTDEESVFGQCKLAGLASQADSRSNQDLFIVHRLDQQTSGLLVLARTQETCSFLSSCWRARNRVHKVYRAVVEDWPPLRNTNEAAGEIRLPMSPHPTERLKWVVDHENGKECLTKWKLLEKRSDGSVVLELSPVTGRTHQLRVHCAAMGGTIRGDSLYGTAGDILYLHAEKLSFPHPSTKAIVSFQADPKW